MAFISSYGTEEAGTCNFTLDGPKNFHHCHLRLNINRHICYWPFEVPQAAKLVRYGQVYDLFFM